MKNKKDTDEIGIDLEDEFKDLLEKSEARLKHLSPDILIKSIEADEHKTKENKKWSQYISTISVVISTFSVGLHVGWGSPSIPILLSDDHPLHLTNDEISNVAIISTAGSVIGDIIFPLLSDHIGRKMAILLAAVPIVCSFTLLQFTSTSVTCLYLARVAGGVSAGALSALVPVYIGEISEARIRGHLTTLVGFSMLLGMLFMDLVGSYNTIETTALIALTAPLLFMLTFCWQPESPYFLLMKGSHTKTRRVLRKLRKNENVDQELERLTNDVNRQMSEKGTYKDLFMTKSNRDALFLMTFIWTLYHFSGITAMQSYAQVIFDETVTFIPKNFCSSFLLFLSLCMYVVSFFLVDRVGRRSIMLFGVISCATCLSLVSIYLFIKEYSSLDVSNLTWIPFILIAVCSVCFDFGIGNGSYCLAGELFSASVKGKATCITRVVFSLAFAASTKIYQLFSDNLGLGAAMMFFALCLWTGLFCTWRFVPETKRKTLEEIQIEMKKNRGI